MATIIIPQLAQLQTLRKHPAILFMTMIGDEQIRVLYECLRALGHVEHLDLVLVTSGGLVTSTRQLAFLLREYVEYLSILVPYRARSSGTLLCLSANEVVLGPMAELGPLDAHIGASGPTPADAPGRISTQDILGFRQMSEDWFGVTREEDRLQVLALLAQRIFPTSLSSFYRSDRLTRQIAEELLAFQLPDAGEQKRKQIVDTLVGGYYSHEYVISRRDARNLGLQVTFPSSEEERLLWDTLLECRKYIPEHQGYTELENLGLIIGPNFTARQVSRWLDDPSSDTQSTTPAGARRRDVTWHIEP